MMSRFVIALFLFLSLGFLLVKIVEPVINQNNLANYPEKTWTGWALEDFNKQKNNPAQIIIMGSSLVLMPINLADAHFKNSTIDGALHHRSDLLSSYMNAENCGVSLNFNFAVPGLMPSDAYLITKRLLIGDNHPKLIIYGVGPRDFVDNLLAGPTSTDPYHCLSKLLNNKDDEQTILSYLGKDWQLRLDYFLGKYVSVYGHRDAILATANIAVHKPNASEQDTQFTVADVHNLLPNYNPMAIGAKQCLFQPSVLLDPDRFNKNLNEYRLRYGKINWNTFICQSTFFMNLLKIARDNDIKVLIVDMPITSVNRQLLPDYIFALYKNNLRVLSKSFGADFFDLAATNHFKDQDFGDTVHLSTEGSTKMVKLIANYISEHKLYRPGTVKKIKITNGKELAEVGAKL